MMEFVIDWVENIVEKGENAGYQYFLLFPQCFEKGFIFKVLKKVNPNNGCTGNKFCFSLPC